MSNCAKRKFLTLLSGIAVLLLISPVQAEVIPFSVAALDDGSLIGGMVVDDAGERAFLLKVDLQGNEVWNRTYAENCSSAIWAVEKVQGGYALGGVSGCGPHNAWVALVDEEGKIIWERIYGAENQADDSVTALLPDGSGFLAAMTVASCSECKTKDTWIVKFDGNGNELWRKVFDFGEYDSIKMLRRTGDGGVIAVGAVSDSLTNLNYDVLVIKLDAQGRVEWKGFFDLGFQDCAWDAAETAGGYTVVGGSWGCGSCANASSPVAKAFVLRLNRSGGQDALFYIEKGRATSAWSVLDDGKTAIAGFSANGTGNYVWIMMGNETILVPRSDFFIFPILYGLVRMAETKDGYLLASSACSGNCIWLGKFGFNGNLISERTYMIPEIQGNESEDTIKVCPHAGDSSAIPSPSYNYGAENTVPSNFNLPFYAVLTLVVASALFFVLSRL